MLAAGFWLDLPVLRGSCHKGARTQSLIFPFYWALPAFQKGTKLGFLSLAWILANPVSSFLSENTHLLLETAPLAPIGVEILLCRGSAQKIETHSGIKLLNKTKIPIFKIQIPNLKMLRLRYPDISTYIQYNFPPYIYV